MLTYSLSKATLMGSRKSNGSMLSSTDSTTLQLIRLKEEDDKSLPAISSLKKLKGEVDNDIVDLTKADTLSSVKSFRQNRSASSSDNGLKSPVIPVSSQVSKTGSNCGSNHASTAKPTTCRASNNQSRPFITPPTTATISTATQDVDKALVSCQAPVKNHQSNMLLASAFSSATTLESAKTGTPTPTPTPTSTPTTATTRPLVISHLSSANKSQSELSIMPSISSQLILSSIINTQANLSQANCSALGQQVPARPKATAFALTSSTIKPPIVSQQATKTIDTTNTNEPPSDSHTNFVGQAVSARLMDMGKRLLDAAREGRVDHVRQLVVDSGAPFTSDWLGQSALHLAAQNCHVEIAEILLRGGVNRDAKTKLGNTPLHFAAQSGCLEVVDLLLIHGCDVNARDMLMMTPLHWSVERGHVLVVEKLLFSGADVDAKSKFHLTPVDIARNSKSPKMIEIFKSWTNKNDILDTYSTNFSNVVLNESSSMLEVDYHLAFSDDRATTSRASMLDIDEPCIDLVELEWNSLKFEPDFFLTNDEDEPRVEYLMKIVEELQKENRQLRKKVEQLSTTCQ